MWRVQRDQESTEGVGVGVCCEIDETSSGGLKIGTWTWKHMETMDMGT